MPEVKPSGLSLYKREAYKGYTLFAPLGGREVYLVDMAGQPVHIWKMPVELGSYGELLPNGNLLYAAKTSNAPLGDFDGAGGSILELGRDSNLVWKYEDQYLHHAFSRLPNGNTLVLRWIKTPEEMAQKVKGGLPNTEKDGVMWGDAIQEINPAGKVVWEWKAYEHLNPEVDIICSICFRNQWSEANSLSVTYDDNILISFTRTSQIALINKETGKIDWRFGEWPELVHPHNACLLANGNLLIFEAGVHIIGYEAGRARILEIDRSTGEAVWWYDEPSAVDFIAPTKGNCQRLPNGNILICEGDYGRIFEVNRNKEIVWEYINPYYHEYQKYGRNNTLSHAYRYGPDYEGLKS